jgi:hypothetical protein
MYLSDISADSSAQEFRQDTPWYRRRKVGYIALPVIGLLAVWRG